MWAMRFGFVCIQSLQWCLCCRIRKLMTWGTSSSQSQTRTLSEWMQQSLVSQQALWSCSHKCPESFACKDLSFAFLCFEWKLLGTREWNKAEWQNRGVSSAILKLLQCLLRTIFRWRSHPLWDPVSLCKPWVWHMNGRNQMPVCFRLPIGEQQPMIC